MSRLSIAKELEAAAERAADIGANLQTLLRRAALMLRNAPGADLDPVIEEALYAIAAEMKIGRSELIQILLREWLEKNGYLPMRLIDEESDTDGNA